MIKLFKKILNNSQIPIPNCHILGNRWPVATVVPPWRCQNPVLGVFQLLSFLFAVRLKWVCPFFFFRSFCRLFCIFRPHVRLHFLLVRPKRVQFHWIFQHLKVGGGMIIERTVVLCYPYKAGKNSKTCRIIYNLSVTVLKWVGQNQVHQRN